MLRKTTDKNKGESVQFTDLIQNPAQKTDDWGAFGFTPPMFGGVFPSLEQARFYRLIDRDADTESHTLQLACGHLVDASSVQSDQLYAHCSKCKAAWDAMYADV